MNNLDHPPTFLDLFCGCGGFSLGLTRAGFQCAGAIDLYPEAISVFRRNFPDVPNVFEHDLTQFQPAEFVSLSGVKHVDVIVGGPPCQGFSTVRRVDGANNGRRMVDDKRRHLYQEFLRYVDFFQPQVFVMENVLGIRSASGGEYFARVQREARALGYRVHAQIEDCVKLGLPQKRRRQLFIGTRLDLPEYFRPQLKPAPRVLPPRSSRREEAQTLNLESEIRNPKSKVDQSLVTSAATTLWEAIGDLPPLAAGEGIENLNMMVAVRDRQATPAQPGTYMNKFKQIHR
jgi:DNA-cytosine methyltransferase